MNHWLVIYGQKLLGITISQWPQAGTFPSCKNNRLHSPSIGLLRTLNGFTLNYFVTGCAGFIGSEFVSQLLEHQEDASVIGFDSLTYAGKMQNMQSFIADKRFDFVKGDINSFEEVMKNLVENSIIVNFAAESHVDRSIANPDLFLETNVKGVAILLKAALLKNARKFVQISTDEVLGSIEKGKWTSESPLLPNSPYAASKASAELLIRSYAKTYGLNQLTTRSSNNYGPRQATEKLIPKLITNSIRNKPLPIYGNGNNFREWIHVADNVKMILSLIFQDKSGTWNIPGGTELSNLQLVELIKSLMPESQSEIEFVNDRKGHDFRYAMDTREFSREVGLPNFISIKDGLRQTIDWYKTLADD